jgi:thiamine biosynthesis protein ThiI
MEKVIILRYGELHLKGDNRGFFEKKLIDDLKRKLNGVKHIFSQQRGRYLISDFEDDTIAEIIERCGHVFGLHSLSVALKCKSDLGDITAACLQLADGLVGTFKVAASRADKRFEYNSMQLNSMIGGKILDTYPQLKVDVHNPDNEIGIDVREEGHTLVFCGMVRCAGGMPLGSSGKGLLLLSGGLDSPVAGYMMLRRGLNIDALHFHSYPYTNERARQKVAELAERLTAYCDRISLKMVKLTTIQEEIKRACDEKYSVIILRMIMMRIAESVAQSGGCGCVISGESLGQVASQTLDSLRVTDSCVTAMPVFRPLIGMDKQEIIDVARRIDTFDISVQPFEDCCTIFLPKHPVTRPDIKTADKELGKIKNLDALIEEAITELDVLKIG